jgi:hypothetical protein
VELLLLHIWRETGISSTKTLDTRVNIDDEGPDRFHAASSSHATSAIATAVGDRKSST